MPSYPKLNFPPVKLRAARRDGADFVWDSVRGCWLLLTPEEWVRRHVIGWLEADRGVNRMNILQEYPVSVEGMPQRADIVVTGRNGEPALLVECKSPGIAIGDSVLDQAVRYNNVIKARYIMLTNGLKHYCYVTYNGTDYSTLGSFPDLMDIL
jgi:Uncharacterized conserved protein